MSVCGPCAGPRCIRLNKNIRIIIIFYKTSVLASGIPIRIILIGFCAFSAYHPKIHTEKLFIPQSKINMSLFWC